MQIEDVAKTQRNESGFSLATIMCLGVCAGMVLLSTAQLMSVSAAKVTNERLTDVMRASAESGLDWAVQQLSNATTRQALDTGNPITIPEDYLNGSHLTGTVTASSITAPRNSYIYSDRLDPNVTANNITGGNAWRVLTARVTNGIRTKSVRVMLKPVYATFSTSIVSTATTVITNTNTSTALVDGQPQPIFAKSMFGKGMISFNGNGAGTDSYNSSVSPNPSGSQFHTTAAQGAMGDVGSNQGVSLGNGNVGGSITVTSGDTTGNVSIGSNGSVTGSVSSSGTVTNSGTVGSTPVQNTGAAKQVLPDPPSAPSTANSTTDFNISGNKTLTLTAGNYVTKTFSISGNSKIVTPASGIVNIYVQGAGSSVSIGGNGITNNSGLPSNVRIWYSGSSPVSISGNGSMRAVVYAPNANVTFNGGGTLYGAVVGNQVTVNGGGGSSTFHYDEALSSNSQLTYIPKVVTTVTSTSTSVATITSTSTATAQNIDHFQAVSWMEF